MTSSIHRLACRIAIGALFAAGLMTGAGFTQPARSSITVGPNVQITADHPETAYSESWIAIHPHDDRRLLACVMMYAERLRNYSTAIFVSSDGGRRWRQTLSTEQFVQSGDPVCEFGPDGTAYFVPLVVDDPRWPEMFVYRSMDSGNTWDEPSRLPFVDREALVFDDTGGPFNGRAYINGGRSQRSLVSDAMASLGMSLFRSDNGFRTVDGFYARDAVHPGMVRSPGNGAVLSDGTLVIVVGDQLDTARSNDPRAERVRSAGGFVYVVRSTDGGRTYEPAVTISDWYMNPRNMVGGSVPRLAVDRTHGPFRDRIYVTWTDLRTGRAAIRLAHSDDEGRTWSSPIIVDDPPARNDPRNGPDSLNPVVAVNKDGIVAVRWADRRDHKDNLGWTGRFTASLDGGETFLPSVPLSTASHTYGDSNRWLLRSLASGDLGGITKPDRLNVTVKLDNFFYSEGDTTGLIADGSGRFHVTWVDNRTGTPQLWTAPVAVEGAVIKHGDPKLSALDDLTRSTKLDILSKRYDRAGNTVTLSTRLKNIGTRTVPLPITIRLVGMISALGNPLAKASENGATGPGATWTFTDAPTGTDLKPGDTTTPKVLTFQIAGLVPLRGLDHFPPMVLDLDFRVLGRLSP
jgi:hypothetical protein